VYSYQDFEVKALRKRGDKHLAKAALDAAVVTCPVCGYNIDAAVPHRNDVCV
jgi:hypothetical protein